MLGLWTKTSASDWRVPNLRARRGRSRFLTDQTFIPDSEKRKEDENKEKVSQNNVDL